MFGEPLDVLTEALLALKLEPSDDPGRTRFHAELTDLQGLALTRALMRSEAELLRCEADQVRDDIDMVSSAGDRRVVALLLVVRRVNDAARGVARTSASATLDECRRRARVTS
ncbi:MAG: hypothetical protein ACLGIG_04175 [Actinomycetes bacterium]